MALAAVLLWACGSPPPAAPATSVSTTRVVPTTEVVPATSVTDTGDLVSPDVRAVTVDGQPLVVAWVDTPTSRALGLMGVEDLGELDGMVFDLGREQIPRFTMRNTVMALDVFFFAADGSGVGKLEMVPCPAEPCPSYTIDEPARYALEAPLGTLLLESEAHLEVGGTASPRDG